MIARPVGARLGVEDVAARAAHRSHLARSAPGGKRPQISRRRVMRAACRIVFERTGAASYSALRMSLLNFERDRPETRPSSAVPSVALHGRPQQATHTICRVRVLAHIKKLDDCFGQFVVRLTTAPLSDPCL